MWEEGVSRSLWFLRWKRERAVQSLHDTQGKPVVIVEYLQAAAANDITITMDTFLLTFHN